MMSPGSDGSSLDSLGNVVVTSTATELPNSHDVGLVTITTQDQLQNQNMVGSATSASAPLQALYPPPGMMYTADGQYLVPNAEYYTQQAATSTAQPEVATYFLSPPPPTVSQVTEVIMQSSGLPSGLTPVLSNSSALYSYPASAISTSATASTSDSVVTTVIQASPVMLPMSSTHAVSVEGVPSTTAENVGGAKRTVESSTASGVATSLGSESVQAESCGQTLDTIAAVTSPGTVPISPAQPTPEKPGNNLATTIRDIESATDDNSSVSGGNDAKTVTPEDDTVSGKA